MKRKRIVCPIQGRILTVVDEIGDPLMEHIVERLPEYQPDQIKAEVRELVILGILKQKSSDIDHAWAYVRKPAAPAEKGDGK